MWFILARFKFHIYNVEPVWRVSLVMFPVPVHTHPILQRKYFLDLTLIAKFKRILTPHENDLNLGFFLCIEFL